ncbi:MBL fold metallo-hydrolase [Peredibacter starrii]|uniref:MBL fold metallo-hydrolase n=1 Tax=Peredibacter starrii TaxID=28202 RepID=A0AAX4HK19_9BACT|nr:MBL fold metallo-hydrolase [Peredibacter starrii]WPU63583.1 MBL fold metallo-hydrolase [Peredibacter starrii]
MNLFRLKTVSFLTAGILLTSCSFAKKDSTTKKSDISITQVRNATLQIRYSGKRLLIDPMLAKKGSYPGFPGTANSHLRNPLVDLPIPADDVIDVDAIIVTHLHLDHWDDEAQRLIPKEKPIFVQNQEDEKALEAQGFKNVTPLTDKVVWEGITISKTQGTHGTKETVKKFPILGAVSGFVLSHPDEKKIYLAGDTVWNEEVKKALDLHRPEIIILNAGAAVVVGEPPIIMDQNDVVSVVKHAPYATVIATHMEAINHCILTRKQLREYLETKKVSSNVKIPMDGENLNL